MKQLLTILFLIVSLAATGQNITPSGNTNQVFLNYGSSKVNRLLWLPRTFTPFATYDTTGAMWFDSSLTKSVWYHNGSTRQRLTSKTYVDSGFAAITAGVIDSSIYATTYRLDTTRKNLYNTKVAYADTSMMLAPYLRSNQKAQPNGVATLDANGLVPTSQLGSITLSNTYVVNSVANMLALAANMGDVAVRTDSNLTFILKVLPATNYANWVQLLTPGSPVQSVNGQIGNVTLTTTDITEGSNLYFTTARARLSLSPGTGIGYDNVTGIITNTSPDQMVTIGNGYGVIPSGAYPSFTLTADTSHPDGLSTIAYRQKGVDSLNLISARKVNYTDTSGMLSGYLRSADTANMLIPYIRTLEAGTGISVTPGTQVYTVTNTAPDQTVTIASGTGATVSGSYPTFTVSATGTGVTGVSSGYGTNFTTITTTGSVIADTSHPNGLSTIAWRQKGVDSLNAIIGTKGTVSSVAAANSYGITWSGSPVTGMGTLTPTVDTATLFTQVLSTLGVGYGVNKNSRTLVEDTATTFTKLVSTLAVGYGLSKNGRTFSADTSRPSGLSTIAYRQKLADSIGAAFVTPTSTNTLTNKRITARVNTTTSYTTHVPFDGDSYDMQVITAQAGALLFDAPTGTPTEGQMLLIRIKDNGTAQALTWNTIFRSGSLVTLPSTTTLGKWLYIEFLYNSTTPKWDIVGVSDGY